MYNICIKKEEFLKELLQKFYINCIYFFDYLLLIIFIKVRITKIYKKNCMLYINFIYKNNKRIYIFTNI